MRLGAELLNVVALFLVLVSLSYIYFIGAIWL